MRLALVILAGLHAVSMAPVCEASAQPARQIAPELVAPPAVDTEDLKREAPRAPLGDVGLAAPPKPKQAKGRDGNTLFKPLANTAGVVEAGGLTVTIAGIEPVAVEEKCTADGKEWACGMRARAAFRSFLRGRAVVCDLPPDLIEGPATAACQIANQDVGGWLASNGWVRALSGGTYEAASKAAADGKKGIFGPAPDLDSLPPEPEPYVAVADDQPVLELPADPAPQVLPESGVVLPLEPLGLY